jgi:hypothetical protein
MRSLFLLTTLVLACSSTDATPSSADATADSIQPVDAGNDSPAPPDPCGPLGATWTRCAANPLARAGNQQADGRYQLSIGDPDVQFDATNKVWRAWWSTGMAAHYTDPTNQMGIKVAESPDGVAWTVQTEVTLAARPNTSDWDTFKLETPTVLIVPGNPPDKRYLMFYSGAPGTKPVNGGQVPWYQLGLAYSADGKTFTRLPAKDGPFANVNTGYGNNDGLVLRGIDAFKGVAGVVDGLLADPEVVWDGSTIHLFYSSLAMSKSGPVWYGIGHATSTDGVHWTVLDNGETASLSGGQGPSVVKGPAGWEIYFHDDFMGDQAKVPTSFNPQYGIRRGTSANLAAWTVDDKSYELTWDGSDNEKYGWVAVGDMTFVNGVHRYYYPAFSALQGPDTTWVAPLAAGGYVPSLMVLDMARRQ